MARFFLYILILLLAYSCSVSHSVKINPDRSAFVQSDNYWLDSIKMVNSEVISDFKRTDHSFSFTIADIDSLGKFLGDFINDNHFIFKYYQDSLVINSNGNFPLEKRSSVSVGYDLKIITEKEIKNVLTKGKGIRMRYKKRNEVQIYWGNLNKRQPKYWEKKVIIEY